MRTRRRLAFGVLLLLLLIGGALLIVLTQPGVAPGPDDRNAARAARSSAERERRHVGAREHVGDPSASTTAEAAHDAVTVGRGVTHAPPATPAPPSEGPVRIRRAERCADADQGALRIRIDDGAGAMRDNVRVRVSAGRGGSFGTVHDGVVGAEGLSVAPPDPGTAAIALVAGNLTRRTVARIEAGLVTEVEFTLPRGATVTGEVRHRAYGLLTSVRVTVDALVPHGSAEGMFQDSLSATTDSAGRYEFIDLTPEEHRVCATKDGYGVLFTGSGAVLDGSATRRDLLLVHAAQLTLFLRDEDKAPVTAAVIVSFRPHGDSGGTRLSTNLRPDADGHVRYDSVLPARYTIVVAPDGYERASVSAESL